MIPMPKTDVPVDIDRLKDRLTKAHITLLSHPETTLYGTVILMGKSEIVDYLPTAATDGVNKFYGAEFCAGLNDAQLRFVVMHENGHVFLRHLLRHKDYWQEDPKTANIAADYAINALIMSLKDKTLCEPPTIGVLYDAKYNGWAFGEIYRDLRKQQPPPTPPPPRGEEGKKGEQPGQDSGSGTQSKQDGGKPCEPKPGDKFGGPGEPLDYHDWSKTDGMSTEQVKDISDKIARAIEQGGLLAGKRGETVPRVVSEANTPKVDWASEVREFVTTHTQGRDDDVSLRRLDKRWLQLDMLMPTTIAETVGEIVFFSDTSGSIDDRHMADAIGELSHLAQTVQPECVRVAWWDHMVHGEQVFMPDQFDRITQLAKPVGGGGTRVSSCAKYFHDKSLKADCVIVMTDGHVERDIEWDSMPPTLWIVTDNKQFNPPVGRVVFINN